MSTVIIIVRYIISMTLSNYDDGLIKMLSLIVTIFFLYVVYINEC